MTVDASSRCSATSGLRTCSTIQRGRRSGSLPSPAPSRSSSARPGSWPAPRSSKRCSARTSTRGAPSRCSTRSTSPWSGSAPARRGAGQVGQQLLHEGAVRRGGEPRSGGYGVPALPRRRGSTRRHAPRRPHRGSDEGAAAQGSTAMGGRRRFPQARRDLRGGWVDTLVTDVGTAEWLVAGVLGQTRCPEAAAGLVS